MPGDLFTKRLAHTVLREKRRLVFEWSERDTMHCQTGLPELDARVADQRRIVGTSPGLCVNVTAVATAGLPHTAAPPVSATVTPSTFGRCSSAALTSAAVAYETHCTLDAGNQLPGTLFKHQGTLFKHQLPINFMGRYSNTNCQSTSWERYSWIHVAYTVLYCSSQNVVTRVKFA